MKQNCEIKIKKWSLLLMLILGGLFYLFPGKWISIESDSVAYIEQRGREGVLPGYPVFLGFFRSVLGEQNYLSGVVIAQSILAILCTIIFVCVLQKQFRLKEWECILLYLATMLPFSIYLPEVGITHQIMTEGITYAIFYLFFAMVLKAVWTLKFRWYIGSLVFAFILGLIRSQMIFLQVISLLVFIGMIWQKVQYKGWKRLLIFCGGALLGVLIAFASYKLIYKVVEYDNRMIAQARIEAQSEKSTQKEKEEQDENAQIHQRSVTSQFDSLIISRGFFEADQEDVALFEDEMMRKIFTRTYELADEGKHLYIYAKPGLYMWEDLVYDQMSRLAGQAIMEYDVENPGVRTRSEASIYQELGFKILLEHFDRYLYHAIRLMMPSFIASVFFQIRPIYLLCHFIALFIYLFAIMGAIIIWKGNRAVSEYMLATVMTLIVMVVVINLVFTGLQRYVVYGMGIFYCAMYLQLKELFRLIKLRFRKKS